MFDDLMDLINIKLKNKKFVAFHSGKDNTTFGCKNLAISFFLSFQAAKFANIINPYFSVYKL
jgi:hypothetical protein